MTVRVLCVYGDPDVASLVADLLAQARDSFEVVTETSVSGSLDRITAEAVDCVVSGWELSGGDSLALLEEVREIQPGLSFVLFTDKRGEDLASEAISAGVTDYMRKRDDTDQSELLAHRIENAVSRGREQRRCREDLEFVLETTDAVVWTIDVETGETTVRPAPVGPYDSTLETIDQIAERVHTDDRERVRTALESGQESGEYSVEYRIRHGDGVRWMADRGRFEFDADDRVVSARGVVRDVTERKRRNLELKRKTRAMDRAPVGILITDPSRTDNPIINANERFVEITGYQESHILGANCRFLQGEKTDEDKIAQMREAIDDGRPTTVLLRNYRKDGTMFWNRVTIAPLENDAGEVVNFVGFQEDLTERKERERKLKHKNERLDEFTSIVSHDLRNPLGLAQTGLELAREESNSEHLETVACAHDRMETLIDDLLALARQGETIADTEPVNLMAMATTCWTTLRTDQTELAVQTERVIEADRPRLQQLLGNLLSNAIEHGAETVRIGDFEDGFYVADDGPGIPEKHRERVFESGYSTCQEGSGFGLSIVEQIAEAHGWEVKATESQHGGARFEVTGVDVVDTSA